jgi:hypothetical protein
VKEYFAANAGTPAPAGREALRVMDCVDCHNMVGHRIASAPEQAVDAALAAGEVSRTLPFARREGVRLVKASYSSDDEAARKIEEELRRFYSAQSGGTIDGAALQRAVIAFQGTYQRNVFSSMKVTWGTYPDNTGHMASPGCFRCHDGSHTANDGSTINADCEYCHRQASGS